MKVLAVVGALVCFVLAVLYWTGSLQLGSSHPGAHHLHAVVLAVIGILALVWLRFQSAGRAVR
jgi:hypothetical protein